MSELVLLRKHKNLTQAQLALEVGVSDKTVGSWERGTRTPRPKEMQKLEDFFGVPKEKIFSKAFSYSK